MWDKLPLRYNGGAVSPNTIYAYFSDIRNPYTGPGYVEVASINNNPQFVDLYGGNLHLQSTSPAIDRGTSQIDTFPYYLPETDIEGTRRPQGNAVDMGAYEYHM